MTDPKLMGNGEGHTLLILTDAESRLIRASLTMYNHTGGGPDAERAYYRGIQRGTDRIKAEFDAELKKRKEAKK